ncbi:amino acid/amide ABC transporter substrate-binding protein (HAAT family) [Anoxybacillus vitaminiphilus]|uniref:Amino acid/amide ABC transporter substrate-binding protein (HAAT family) n=1 Tax=Paranoxybacillus vitaminiphilus TaxID=581036 RepID=A0A327Y5L9_9BACL|nr:ABC transporter substrate-binding protein [Anoxybacillus vitaminiphilus]RAK15045.1 amino acid/amide ABC transporter substrate-binding protein (HAAT family) [Anoxybacillus vitaminiphilus]
MKKAVKGRMLLALLIVFLFGIAGCGSQSTTQTDNKGKDQGKVVKIGVIVAETGPASTLGHAQANTVKLIQKELDQQGPINGTKIQLIMHDYETNDTKAVIAMDKLISEGVVAVVGATQTSTTMAILPKAVQANIPLMATAPVSTDKENVYMLAHSSSTIISQVVDYLVKHNIKKVAWLNARDAFGVIGLPAFKELAKQHDIEIVAHEEFDATASDMTVQLTNIRKKNPEAVIVWSRTPGAGIVARNFKSLGFTIPMFQSTAAANKGFIEQVQGNSDNIMVVGSKLSVVDQLPESDQKKRILAFRDAYVKEFGEEPDLFAAHAYDGIQLIIEAVKAGKTTAKDIQNFLKNELKEYPAISGTLDLTNPLKGAKADGLTLLRIENNQWKYNQ